MITKPYIQIDNRNEKTVCMCVLGVMFAGVCAYVCYLSHGEKCQKGITDESYPYAQRKSCRDLS